MTTDPPYRLDMLDIHGNILGERAFDARPNGDVSVRACASGVITFVRVWESGGVAEILTGSVAPVGLGDVITVDLGGARRGAVGVVTVRSAPTPEQISAAVGELAVMEAALARSESPPPAPIHR